MKTNQATITDATTTRDLRRILFRIDSAEADALRHELFEVNAQDFPASPDALDRVRKLVHNG